MIKIPKIDPTHKIIKMTKTTLKPLNDQNILETSKMTRIPLKFSEQPKQPQNLKNDHNTAKRTKYP